MSKANKLYKIFMTSMIVIIAGLLLATGIIAIQKQMKLKTSFDYIPGVDVEVFVKNDDNPTEKLIFRNYANGTNGIYVNSTYCSLSATTLTFNNAFVTAYGNNFTLVVYNYSNFTIATEITSTTTAKVGANTVEAVEPEITPPTARIEIGESGKFVISCEPIIPQETVLQISFEQFTSSTLKTGQEVNTAIGTSATSVVFGDWSDYESEVSQTWDENETDLSLEENDDSIKIFSGKTDSNAKYILSENRILANEDCSYMFNGCTKIESLNFENFYTDDVTNMSYMFSNYRSSAALDLSSFDTSNVTDMSDMFSYYSSRAALDLSSFDTSKVTNMSYMFYEYHSRSSAALDLSSFDTSNVTNMMEMFSFYSSRAALDLSSFDTSNVTNMMGMFTYYNSSEALDLSSFDTSNVTNMNSMFMCSTLTSIDLSNFDTSKVTDMSHMFNSCSNLTTIYVSEKWSTEKVTSSYSYRMFYNCTSLVGGAGTTCNGAETDDVTYAKIDGGSSNPGYFTRKTII